MLARLLVIVLLVLLPGVASAQKRPPNALEVGAGVATCMTESRRYPPGGEVEMRGNIHEVTLLEESVEFATLHRPAYDSARGPWLTGQSVQSPMALDLRDGVASDKMRETMRYAISCFGQVYDGS